MEQVDAAYRNRQALIAEGPDLMGSNLAHRLVASGVQVTLVDALLPRYGANRYNLREVVQ